MPPMRRSRSVSHLDLFSISTLLVLQMPRSHSFSCLDLNTHRRDPEARGRILRRANSLDVSVGGSGASGGGTTGVRGDGTAGGGGGGGATYANQNPDPVNLGMQIVGILIIPVVMGVIGGLSQLVLGVEKVDPNEKLMLYICAGISLTTVVLATVLVILCLVRWINNRRRDCIMWSVIAAAVSLTFIDMCLFVVSILIAMQSKKH